MLYSRANHSKFVTKELSKAIVLRSKLRKEVFKREQKNRGANTKNKEMFVYIYLEKAKRTTMKILT